MKKTKYLVLALAVMILIAGVIGVSASAEGEASLSIAKKNVSFLDTPTLVFAVEANGVDAEDIELRVYNSPDAAEYYTANAMSNQIIGGVEYPAFYIAGVYPKDIANEVYVKAVAGDVESEMLKYSVLEYALEGIATYSGVEGKERLLSFYQNIIEYSSDIQYVLSLSGKFDGINAADYNYVKVNGGTVNGYSTAVVADGNVTLALTGAVPSGQKHTGWSITVGNETAEVTGNTVTITDSCTIAPIFEANGSVETVTEGETFDTQPALNASGYYAVNKIVARGTKGTDTDTGIFEIVADPKNSNNSVAKLGKTQYGVDNSKNVSYVVSSTSKKTAPSLIVFETKILINPVDATGATNDRPILQIGMAKGATASHLLVLRQDVDGGEYFYFTAMTGPTDSTLAENNEANRIAFNEWAAVRIEVENTGDLTTTITRLYINNVYVGEFTGGGDKSINDLDSGIIYYQAGSNPCIYIDNSSIKETSLAQ